MEVTISEGSLVFSFHEALNLVRFDDEHSHGMSRSMKAVDFVVQFANETWLIEVKDPDAPEIPEKHKEARNKSFATEMREGYLVKNILMPKLRDSLVYLSLAHRSPISEIKYIVLISMAKLDKAMLLTLQDNLRKSCYCPGPFGRPWPSRFQAFIFNFESWNRDLHPHSIARRGADA